MWKEAETAKIEEKIRYFQGKTKENHGKKGSGQMTRWPSCKTVTSGLIRKDALVAS
jgi:hypothetical protein